MGNATVIATLGEEIINERNFEKIENLIEMGIERFRFNLSRYVDYNDFEKNCMFVKEVKMKYQTKANILVDLPFPGEKIRIFHDKLYYISIKKLESFLITSNHNLHKQTKKSFFTNIPDIGKTIKIGETILYADGECELKVISIEDMGQSIEVKTNCDCKIFARKSLTYGKKLKNKMSCLFLAEKVKEMKVDSIALSFVSDSEEVCKFKKAIDLNSIKIYSKIENLDGVKNVDAIARESHIMIGRGDLLLNIKLEDLMRIQEDINNIAKKYSKEVIVATGILASMAKNYLPTQSEVIDLSTIFNLIIDGIIINYGVVRSQNIVRVLKLIEKFENKKTLGK